METKVSAKVQKVVAGCIERREWRSSCEQAAICYGTKSERKDILAYVRAQYDAAGAGFSGRFQS